MMVENEDIINLSGKAIVVIVILLLLLIGTFGMFLLKSSPNNTGSAAAQSNDVSGKIPEKCKLPAGQDLNAWKEHLRHHAETQDCLKYFK